MSDDRPTFISLFAGIGGIDLGLERAGWRCVLQVEWDPFCQRVLAKHWPDVPRLGDITTVDWSTVERPDLLAGGFPCQPVSSVGKRKAQADERWLWPEFLRAIRALRPRYVLVENVVNLLAINGGSVFGGVLGDLAASGYDSEWDCIPASAVGALHERDRVWIVAYPNRLDDHDSRYGAGPVFGRRSAPPDLRTGEVADADGESWNEGRTRDTTQGQTRRNADRSGVGSPLVHANRGRREPGHWRTCVRGVSQSDSSGDPRHGGETTDSDRDGLPRPRVYPGRRRLGQAEADADGQGPLIGRSTVWLVEPDVGRVASRLSARVDRLRSLGNAVVPQVVEVIGRWLREAEGLNR